MLGRGSSSGGKGRHRGCSNVRRSAELQSRLHSFFGNFELPLSASIEMSDHRFTHGRCFCERIKSKFSIRYCRIYGMGLVAVILETVGKRSGFNRSGSSSAGFGNIPGDAALVSGNAEV